MEKSQHKSTPKKTFNAKKAAMLKALHDNLGLVTQAAAQCGIERTTHYLWLRTDPDYVEAVKELNNVTMDFVEEAHFRNIRKGESANIIFHLKCRGKERGYFETKNINLSGGLDLNLPEEEKTLYDDSDTKKLEEIKEILES